MKGIQTPENVAGVKTVIVLESEPSKFHDSQLL